MIAHNLCYTTLIPRDQIKNYKPEDYTKTPVGYYFLKKHIKEGLIPVILSEILKARQKAKDDMKKEKDPLRYSVLNGRQLALKCSANSVYGSTGASTGNMPCVEISSSVTAFGREMIDKTKKYVEEKYSKKNGFKWNAEVLYGDTDSVMVKFGTKSLEESMKLGKEAAEKITKELYIPPIMLDFEKCYFPFLLLSKKRYLIIIN